MRVKVKNYQFAGKLNFMSKKIRNILVALAGLILLAVLIYQIPYVKSVVDWRVEKFSIYFKNTVNPIGPVPTALPFTPQPSSTPTIASTSTVTPMVNLTPSITPTATFAPLPAQASIRSPQFEQQTPNNCGPATLSMMLHLYGWDG